MSVPDKKKKILALSFVLSSLAYVRNAHDDPDREESLPSSRSPDFWLVTNLTNHWLNSTSAIV